MEIESETLDARVPNLILQPIVENAIRHGIVAQIAPGRIEIRASRVNGTLQLQVTDNGPGLSSAQDSSDKLRGGLGLANTRARLKQLYGVSHRFDLSDVQEGGLQVTLEIPFDRSNSFAQEEKVIAR